MSVSTTSDSGANFVLQDPNPFRERKIVLSAVLGKTPGSIFRGLPQPEKYAGEPKRSSAGK